MDIVTILVALVLLFLVWKIIKGVIKFGVMALIVAFALWLLMGGV